MNRKIQVSAEELCDEVPGSMVFCEYIKICRNYAFEDEPNYDELLNKFSSLFLLEEYKKDFNWDWD